MQEKWFIDFIAPYYKIDKTLFLHKIRYITPKRATSRDTTRFAIGKYCCNISAAAKELKVN